MDKMEFHISWEVLCHRFNKPLKKELANVYFQRLRHIPSSIFKEIVKNLIDQEKFFPTPMQIKNEYHQYLETNPDKKARKNISPCNYCDGSGYLEYRYHNNELNRDYNVACRCGHCENWKENNVPSAWPLFTIKDIESHGFTVIGRTSFNIEYTEKEEVRKQKPKRSVAECIGMVGKKMPYKAPGGIDDIPF